MATYLEGTTIKAKAKFKNSLGALVDPTNVFLKYKRPDSVVVTLAYDLVEITKTAVGNYEVYVTLDQPGKYVFRWEGSGNNGSVSESEVTVTASQVI